MRSYYSRKILSVILVLFLIFSIFQTGYLSVRAAAEEDSSSGTPQGPVQKLEPTQESESVMESDSSYHHTTTPAGMSFSIRADGIIVKYKSKAMLSMRLFNAGDMEGEAPELVKIEPEDGQSIDEKISELTADPAVEYAEPNYIFSSQAVNDPQLGDQWAFPVLDTEDAWSDLQLFLSDAEIEARSVEVAIIDTGIDGTHEDLAGRVAAGKNILTGNDIAAGSLSDDSVNSHGTMVAGIIVANTDNDKGITGMTGDYPVSLIPVKVLDQNGYGTMLDIINGILWAADQGADVINMSFGARLPDYPLALADAVRYAGNKGVTLIAAAGNEGVSIKGFYPADLEGVLSAAAYEKLPTKYSIAGFSNTDYLWNAYEEKCFLLPGVNILTTQRMDQPEQYGLFTGTSASAAFLSSFAALLATCSDPGEAKDRILESIQDGAYYGDLTVNIYDAPTAYNVTDEFWYYNGEDTPWVAFRYEGDQVVRGTMRLPVYVNQPDQVDSVSFYMCEGIGDLSSEKTLLETIPNNDGKTMDNYTLEWDTTGLEDGVYTLYAKINRTGAEPDELNSDDWDLKQLSVYNDIQSGISISVRQADGSPSVGAVISVWEVRQGDSGEEYACVLEEPAKTDADGNLDITGLTAADGLEYLITARGTHPGFYFMERVTSPARIVFSTADLMEITASGINGDTVLQGAGFLVKPLLPGSILQSDNAQSCIGELGNIPLGKLDNNGTGTFYASPGSYRTSVLDGGQLYYLTRDVVIPEISEDATPEEKRMTLDYSGEILGAAEILLQAGTNDTPDLFGVAFDPEDTDEIGSLIGFDLFTTGSAFRMTPGTYTMAATEFYSNPSSGTPYRHSLITYNLGRLDVSGDEMIVIGGETPGGDRFLPDTFYVNEKEISLLLKPEIFAGEDACYRVRFTDAQEHPVVRSGSVEIVESPDGGVIVSYADDTGAGGELFPAAGMISKKYNYDYNPLFLYRNVNGSWKEVDLMGNSIAFLKYSMKTGEAFLKTDAYYLMQAGSYKAEVSLYPVNTPYLIQDGLFDVLGANTEQKNLTILATLDGTNPWWLEETWEAPEFAIYRLANGVYQPYPSEEYTLLVNEAFVGGSHTLKDVPFGVNEPLLLVLYGKNGQLSGGYPEYTLLYRHFALSELLHDESENTWTIMMDGTDSQLIKAAIRSEDETGAGLDNMDGTLPTHMEYGLTFTDASGNPAYFSTGSQTAALWLPNTADYTVTAARIPQDRAYKSYFLSGELAIKNKAPGGVTETLELGGAQIKKISVSLNGKDTESAYRIIGVGLKPTDVCRPSAFYPPDAFAQGGGGGGGMGDLLHSEGFEGVTQSDSFDVWASPGIYEADVLFGRYHATGGWGYRLSGTADISASDASLQTDDDFTLALDMNSLYISTGSGSGFLPEITDSAGNRLVTVLSVPVNQEDWPFGTMNFDTIAPAISVRNQEGVEIRHLREGDVTLSGGISPLVDVEGGRMGGAFSLKEYCENTTYFSGIAENLTEGAYTATISLGAGPEGIQTGECVGFMVRDPASAPTAALFGPEKPVNTLFATVEGISTPGAELTLSYTVEGNPGASGDLSPITADARGYFEAEIPLQTEGVYSITVAVSHDGQLGTQLAPVLIHADRTPPSAASDYTAAGQDETTVLLTWTASTDTGSGLSGYRLFKDGVKIAELGAEAVSYTDTHLSSGINYSYLLVAFDMAGNEGEAAETVGNPSVEGDTSPPSAPSGLSAENAQGSVVLRWSAAEDNIGVTQYIVCRGSDAANPAEIARVAGGILQYEDRGVGFNKTYYYRIDAVDAAGNQSLPDPKEVVLITTDAPVISDVRMEIQKNAYGYASGSTLFLGVYANSGATVAIAAIEYEKWDGDDEASGSSTATADVPLTEAPKGYYSASTPMPEGTARINSILVKVGDASYQAQRVALSDTLEFTGSLAVQVVSPESNDISKFRLEYLSGVSAEWKGITTTSGAGLYMMEAVSPGTGGKLRFLDDKGNLLAEEEGIGIVSGLIANTEVSIQAVGTLRIKVVNSEGTPVEDVSMTLLDAAGAVSTMAKSASDGWVRKLLANGNPTSLMDLLYFVPAGQQYTVRFSKFDNLTNSLLYKPFAERVFVLEPGLNQLEIVLESQARVDVGGQVVDFDTGLPVPGIIVDARSAGGGGHSAVTDINGTFLFGKSKPLPTDYAVTLTARSKDDTYQTEYLQIQPEDLENPHEIRIREQAYVDLFLDIQVKTFANGEYYAFNDERNKLEFATPGSSRLKVDFSGVRVVQKSLTYYRVYGSFAPGQEIPVTVDGSEYNLNAETAQAKVSDDGKSAIATIQLEEKPRINVHFADENGNLRPGLYRTLALFDTSDPANPRIIGISQFTSADTFIHAPGGGTYSLVAAWGIADGRDQQKYEYWQGLADNKRLLVEDLSPEGLMEINAQLVYGMTLFPKLERNYLFLDGVYNFPNGAMGINYQVSFTPSNPLGKAGKFIYHVTLPAGITVQAKPAAVSLRVNTLPDGRLDVVSGSLEDYAAGNYVANEFALFIEVPPGLDKTGLFTDMWAEYTIGDDAYTEKIRQVEMAYVAHTLEAPDVVYGEDLVFFEDLAGSGDGEEEGEGDAEGEGTITVSGSATGPEVPAEVTIHDGSREAARFSIQGGIDVRWSTRINLRKRQVPGKASLRAIIQYRMPDSTLKTYETQNVIVNIVNTGESSGEYVKFNLHGFGDGITYSHTFLPDSYGKNFKFENLNIFQGDILYSSFEVKLNNPHLYENVEIAAVSAGEVYDVIPLTYYPDEGIFYGFGTLGEDGSMIQDIRLMYDLKTYSSAFPFTMEVPEEVPDQDDFYWRLPEGIRDAEITVGSPDDNSDPPPAAGAPVDFEELAGVDGEYILPEITITLSSGDQFIVRQKYYPADGRELTDSQHKLDLGGGKYTYLDFEETSGERFATIIRAPMELLLPMEAPEGFSAAGYGLGSEIIGMQEMFLKLNDLKDYKDTIGDMWENVEDFESRMKGLDQLAEDLAADSCGGAADGMIDSTLKGMRQNVSQFALGKTLMDVTGYVVPGAYNAVAAEMGGIVMDGYEGLFTQHAMDILGELQKIRDVECDNDEDDDDEDDDDDGKKRKKKRDVEEDICEPVVLVDPSGYVFEAVDENRLEGVSATIYYKDATDKWQPYDSEAYDQGPNPNITDAAGKYGWDVFSGEWQVVYEKEGYQTERSEILPVPPPHLDVNISMVSLEAPAVTQLYAGSGGAYIQMEFSHYMPLEAVTDQTVTVTGGSGAVTGTVSGMGVKTTSAGNKQYLSGDASSAIVTEDGVQVARTFRFVPEDPGVLAVGSVYTVIVSGDAAAYNKRAIASNPSADGLNPGGDWEGTLTIPETAMILMEGIRFDAEPVITLSKGQSIELAPLLKIEPADANAYTITWSSSRTDIAAVNGNGRVTGLTKGTATVFARADTGLTAAIGIKVHEEPRTIPLSADDTKNSIQFCRESLTVGQGCYMMATGDRQSEMGLVAGDERYIPISWYMNDAAGSQGSWTNPPYSTAYTASAAGALITWALFRKQVFDGEKWVVVSGSDRTKSYTITVNSAGGDTGGDTGGTGGDTGGDTGGTGGTSGTGTIPGGTTTPGTGTGGALVFHKNGSPANLIIRLLTGQDAGVSELHANTGLFAARMNAVLRRASQLFQADPSEGSQEPLEFRIPLDPALIASNGVDKKGDGLGIYRYDPEKKQWEYILGKYDEQSGTMVFTTDKRGIFAAFDVTKTFPDISGSWAKEYIEILAARQIVDGTGKGNFEPQLQLSRAEFLKMLMKALEIDLEAAPETGFSDINQDQWYYRYAATAEKLGIVRGDSEGRFNPNAPILRQDIAVMTVRALQAADISLHDKGFRKQFVDEGEISAYAAPAIELLVMAGILIGTENGEFLPKSFATRAEAVKIIYLLR